MNATDALARYRRRCSPKMQAAVESFNKLSTDERLELVFMMIMANNGALAEMLDTLGMAYENGTEIVKGH